MKRSPLSGDRTEFSKIVTETDLAILNGSLVHNVYSTFSLARDAEWTTRQFVIDVIEDHEEGIGTSLTVEHRSPAFLGDEINFTAWVESFDGNELLCRFEAKVGPRLIATGTTGQRILPKEKLERILSRS